MQKDDEHFNTTLTQDKEHKMTEGLNKLDNKRLNEGQMMVISCHGYKQGLLWN